MNNHELKVANTKKLTIALLATCFIMSTTQLWSTDHLPPKDNLAHLAVSSVGITNHQSENSFIVEQEPIELKISLTLKIDLGESLSSLIRDFIAFR